MFAGEDRWIRVSGTKTHITTGPAGIWGVNSGKCILFKQCGLAALEILFVQLIKIYH